MSVVPDRISEGQLAEFFNRLEGPEGCDFRGEGDAMTWTCAGGQDVSLARKVLARMKIDPGTIEALLGELRRLGGHCDCEILFNAVAHYFPE